MFFKVEDNKIKEIKGFDTKEECEVVKIVHRIKDELKGFLEYKDMVNNGNTRYATPSMQEFQHMLLALDDFMDKLLPLLNAEEKEELHRFIQSQQSKAVKGNYNA